MKHISDYLYDEDKNFTPEKLITDLGLYEGVLIDTSGINCTFDHMTNTYPIAKDVYTQKRVLTAVAVSEDVKALHRFLLFKDNIMLPCSECRRAQPFSPTFSFNPQSQHFYFTKNVDGAEKAYTSFTSVERSKIAPSSKHNLFDNLSITYISGVDKMELCGSIEVDSENFNMSEAALSCIDGISQYYNEIRRDFICSLDKSHHVTAYYIIHKATEVCKDKNESTEYEKLKYCLVLEKVGQEPSMADIQMFDIEKYRKVLSDDSFSDFSMALGLYASGVGCGSLLYLRRIYETLIKDAQDNCSKLPEWNAEEYSKKRFNEKIEYLEALGVKIIPDDLSDVKGKIYGWLSKGVHELSEQDSKELFPYLKYAIELVLDEKLAQKEKEAKLEALHKKLSH